MLLATLMFAAVAVSPVSTTDNVTTEEAENVAHLYAGCAGLWDVMSLAAKGDGKTATAEQYHNMGNGAETTAMWILAFHHNIGHPDDQKTIGAFRPMIGPRREAALNHYLALLENKAISEIEKDIKMCTDMLTFQDDTLTNIRRDRVSD